MMAGNMAGNGMPANMNSMQRAQPGNQDQQLYAIIVARLNATKGQLQGWQTTFDVNQRATQVVQMVTQLRMLQPDLQHCLNVALTFEIRIYQAAQNKEDYSAQMRAKFLDIVRKRQETAQNVQPGMQMPPNMGVPNNAMNMGNMDMSGNGIGMANGQMNPGANAQNPAMLSHLQRPMQPSPLPPQDQPTTLNPAALQNNGMPPQMPNMNQSMGQQQPNLSQGGPIPVGQAAQSALMSMVRAMYDSMSSEAKDRARRSYMANMTEQERIDLANKPSDPLLRALLPKARAELLKRRNMQQQNGNGMEMDGNVQQPPNTQPGALGMDYSGVIAQQQATALRQQQSGDQVVPASNNDNFTAGAMPQNVNPQMLGNQSSQAVNNPQLQQLMLQQQQQQRMLQQQNMNALAQRQAAQQQQQANQLRGQPGGLNAPNALNGGPTAQLNSPAMPMLNRPMPPPGHAAPGTPQPQGNRPPQGTDQLLQHYQQMTSQNNQGMNQPMQEQPQQRPQRTPQDIQAFLSDPQVRARIAAMPEAERARIVAGLRAGHMPRDASNNLPPNLQPGSNMNMPGILPNGQVSAGNGLPQNMGTNVPQFNSQPPSSQQPNGQAPVNPMQMQQGQRQNLVQMRQRAMDMRPFPPQLLHQLGVTVPENVKVWGQLKQHVSRLQSVLPPNTQQKVQSAQINWFETHPEEINLGVQQLRVQQQRQQQAQQANQQQQLSTPVSMPPGMPVPNGQAPPAQMIPPTAPMQAPNQNGNMQPSQAPRPVPNIQPPTAQDVQNFRQHFPNAVNMTDEQIRDTLWKRRRDIVIQQTQTRQREDALRHAQRTQQQAQNVTGNANQQGQKAGPPPQQRAGLPNTQAQAHGQKRPPQSVDDDVMEIPNPNAPPAPLPTPTLPMQEHQAQQMKLPQGMSREQHDMFMKMPAEKRAEAMALMQAKHVQARHEAIKKAQMGLPNAIQSASAPQQQQPGQPPVMPQGSNMAAAQRNGMVEQKLRALYAEVERQNPKGPAVSIDAAGIQQAQQMLARLWLPISRMHSTFPMAAQLPGFETRLKAAMKAKVMVSHNVTDANGNIKDYLSLGLNELKQVEVAMHVYFKDIKAAKERMDVARMQQQQVSAQPVPAQAPALAQSQQQVPAVTGKPTPAVGKSTSQQAHGREASNNGKAPPAPTEHKTFDFPSPNPHGVPKYESNRKELTPDKLKFPPSKKRRTGQPESQDSTPAAQMGTPGALPSPSVPGVKTQSPDQVRKSQAPFMKRESSEAEHATFRCGDLACERSVKGFESERQLKEHEAEEHMPIDDPLEFLLENAAQALGVDRGGNPLPMPKPVAIKAAPRATPAPAAKPGLKRDGRTPNVKQEVSTPQSSGPLNKAQAKAATAATTEAPAPEKTLREVLEERMGFEPAAKSPPQDTSNAPVTDDFFQDLLQDKLRHIDGISDWTNGEFAGVTDWGLRPEQLSDVSSPEFTPPSDVHSQFSESSDISQSERMRINFEWDPWGAGDTDVPEALGMQGLGIGTSPAVGGDVAMAEGVAEKSMSDEKKANEVDEFDWSADERTDWNTLFGSNAGLEDLHLNGTGIQF